MLKEAQIKPAKANQKADPTDLFSDTTPQDVKRVKALLDSRFSRKQTGLVSETMTITPAMAEYILERCNKWNRPLRAARVSLYVKQITSGNWELTSQSISFSPDGLLNNGQHRLRACVLSGMPIQTYVTFGEKRDVFGVLDTGGVRGGSDILSIAGYPNTNHLAASARISKSIVDGRWKNNPQFSNAEILEFVDRNPNILVAMNLGLSAHRKLKYPVGAFAAGFFMILSNSSVPDVLGKIEDFKERVAFGKRTDSCRQIVQLRDGFLNKLIDDHYRHQFARNIAVAASVVKTWNAFVGKKGATIKFDQFEDHFPEVV